MADRETELIARLAPGVASLDAAAWDRLAGSDPFLSHAFLSALEVSGSVGPGTGWTPAPIMIEDETGALAAAAPAYLKTHSQGEYVFDHAWADAYQRAGGQYYPKLQIAVPFTPVPGPRLLGHVPQRRGWLIRHGIQYHWLNRGYGDFDEFLAALTSRKRKAIRKERAAARQGLEFAVLTGSAIGAAEWDAMWAFYQDTGSRKWGQPYLTRAFFDQIGETMSDRLLLFLAYRDGTPIAGALNLIGPDTLYGRYWGTIEEVPFLHFELSYYQAIEWAIEHRLSSVQAGAQGEHKLARGYEPVISRSAHFLADPGLRRAVATYLDGERPAIAAEAEWERAALPYRAASSG